VPNTKAKSINDPKFGVWWEETAHLKKAAEYNKVWGKFLKDKPTYEAILIKGREMMKKEGILVNY
jgi:hypothetical protein